MSGMDDEGFAIVSLDEDAQAPCDCAQTDNPGTELVALEEGIPTLQIDDEGFTEPLKRGMSSTASDLLGDDHVWVDLDLMVGRERHLFPGQWVDLANPEAQRILENARLVLKTYMEAHLEKLEGDVYLADKLYVSSGSQSIVDQPGDGNQVNLVNASGGSVTQTVNAAPGRFDDLLKVLALIRTESASAGLSQPQRAQVATMIADLEAEAKTKAPDEGKMKRLGKGLLDFGKTALSEALKVALEVALKAALGAT